MIVYEAEIDRMLPSGTRLRRRELSRFLRQATEAVGLAGDVGVLLTGDAAVRRMNREYRGKDKATDVLSFPAETEGVAGDLAISVERAARQAEVRGHPLEMELQVLLLHGLLHLAGYDHETDSGQMRRRELRLRRELGLREGLIERVETSTARKAKSTGTRRVR